MCFIKRAFQNHTVSAYDHSISTHQAHSEQPLYKEINYEPFSDLSANYQQTIIEKDPFIWPHFFSKLVQNASLLTKLEQKCDQSSMILEQACIKAKNSMEPQPLIPAKEVWKARDKNVEKLFGNKEYQFKLKIKQKFPNIIYKERNINLAIELIDAKKNIVMNANLVHLGVAACRTDGQWVPETENGDSFIQGKTEADLYHGEASFAKIYPRDVSRSFPNGRVHLIVYPKPSLLRFHSSASNLEQHIEAEDIEPLIIKDITIKAKKRNSY